MRILSPTRVQEKGVTREFIVIHLFRVPRNDRNIMKRSKFEACKRYFYEKSDMSAASQVLRIHFWGTQSCLLQRYEDE